MRKSSAGAGAGAGSPRTTTSQRADVHGQVEMQEQEQMQELGRSHSQTGSVSATLKRRSTGSVMGTGAKKSASASASASAFISTRPPETGVKHPASETPSTKPTDRSPGGEESRGRGAGSANSAMAETGGKGRPRKLTKLESTESVSFGGSPGEMEGEIGGDEGGEERGRADDGIGNGRAGKEELGSGGAEKGDGDGSERKPTKRKKVNHGE